MDIFVLGKRAAQWLSEQLLGTRGTKAEPVAPRLWRGPGSIACDDSQCSWECRQESSGIYAWQLIAACPTGCYCPRPVADCDTRAEGSRVITDCENATDTTTTGTTTTGTSGTDTSTSTTDTSTTTPVLPCDQIDQSLCSVGLCSYSCAMQDGQWVFVLQEGQCPRPDCCRCEEVLADHGGICRCVPDYVLVESCGYIYSDCRHDYCEWSCDEIAECVFAWVERRTCACEGWQCDPPDTPCNIFTWPKYQHTTCTLTPPSTTTTTTPRACLWLCSLGVYSLVNNTCGQPECCCSPPGQLCLPYEVRRLTQVPCNCPSPPPPPSCSDYCTWTCGWSDEAMADIWLLQENRCNAASGCICDPPSPITCSIPGEGTMTPCYRPDSTSSTTTSGTTSGTTTTGEPCSQHVCKWKCVNWDGRFFWQRIEHCPQGCLCNNDVMPPEEECVCDTVGQVRTFTCHPPTTTTTETTTTSVDCLAHFCNYYCAGGVWTLVSHDCPVGCDCVTPPSGPCPGGDGYYARACEPTTTTTSSTTTTDTTTTETTTTDTTTTETTTTDTTTTETTTTDTTTTETTTTDTTTSQDCMSWYCYASCQTDGEGNYYWLIFEPCPSGCQCRPDLHLVCDEWNLGGHTVLCDY
jgi:hypothetical protein